MSRYLPSLPPRTTPRTTSTRLVFAFVLMVSLLIGMAASNQGQQQSEIPPPSASPSQQGSGEMPGHEVRANRYVPKANPPPANWDISDHPTDGELSASRIFGRALAKTDQPAIAEENRELASAMKQFERRHTTDDVSAITSFLDAHPQSPWRISVLTELGRLYNKSGYLSKALDAWGQAWETGKDSKDPQIRLVVDSAFGELVMLNARVGRVDALDALFAEMGKREVHGAATELVAGAREGLWMMKNKPERSLRCGPLAVNRIRAFLDPSKRGDVRILQTRSGKKGMSLVEVRDYSRLVGLNFQMAKRSLGAKMILPSVLHWKLGHYAALVQQKNGLFQIEDSAYGRDLWVTQNAIDEETSGYYLVPPGKLPTGWTPVSDKEGGTIWGKGQTSGPDPHRDGPCDKKTNGGCGSCQPMAQYDIHSLLVSLNIVDTPVPYTAGIGPNLPFQVTYNQRDGDQDSSLPFSNMGLKWTMNCLSYVEEESGPLGSVDLYEQGGGVFVFQNFTPNGTANAEAVAGMQTTVNPIGTCSVTGFFQQDVYSQSVLERSSAPTGHPDYYPIAPGAPPGTPPVLKDIAFDQPIAPTIYKRHLSDGSTEIYAQPADLSPSPTRVYLSQIIAKDGTNTITFSYDYVNSSNCYRVSAITDALGQVTTFSYGLTSDPLKVTKVTDPFGRSAQFQYNSLGQLTQITDIIGITSQFTYGPGDFINSITTPYGTTNFAYGDSSTDPTLPYNTRWIEATDPYGAKERVEFRNDSNEYIPSNETVVPQGSPLQFDDNYLNYRNTFYWSKQAMMIAPGDYTKARITHWCHDTDNPDEASGILESEKQPLENRVWYQYPGQSDTIMTGTSSLPSTVARVLDDGSTQAFRYQYNEYGNKTQAIDPLNRETDYSYYTNDIDLKQITQKNGQNQEIQAQYTYNSQHLILTATDAAGQGTSYTYTPDGQIQTLTRRRNGANETTTYAYVTDTSANGYGMVKSITGPVAGATTTFTYDNHSRVQTQADSEGYTLNFAYDDLDRLLTTTYPDNTFEQAVYNRLDMEWMQDRLGRWTHSFHDALRHLVAVKDPATRWTRYDWCPCGALEDIVDGNGNKTTFFYDIQSRVIRKAYADNTGLDYAYESTTSRLKSVTDAKSQRINYGYNSDNTLRQISYTDTDGNTLNPATPTVGFNYDTVYKRVTSMADGSGTTNYTYYPVTVPPALGAGKLATVTGPLVNSTISYSYDEYGRILTRSVNGAANTNTVAYDALGRMYSVTNPLGSFNLSYVNQTNRLKEMDYPNGQKSVYSYFALPADPRLQEISNQNTSGGNISTFDYGYDAAGEITTWNQLADANASNLHTMAYDAANQLLCDSETSGGASIHQYGYQYDFGGNRLIEQIDGNAKPAGYNNLDQLITIGGTAPSMVFTGTLNKPGTVAIAGGSPVSTVGNNNQFSVTAPVTSGINLLPIKATDVNGNVTTQHISVAVLGTGTLANLSYDLDGNLTNDGTNTYEWDAANRLVAINEPGGGRTQFVYDGLGRRVRITESANGTVVTTKNLIWDNREIIEERDASDNVTKQYFSQGMMLNGSPYYYTKDHLGSIRELINSTGTVVTRYDYDPYGRRTRTSGSVDSDFGYTGDYYHAPSQLCLTLYRAYSPSLGRWLSRDALANAYGYLPIETTLSLFSGYISTNLYDYVDGNPIKNIDKLGLCPHDCCHAKPLPDSDNACNDYGDDTYAGTSLKCFCRCAGNSRWSQQVRGCLACEHKNQVSPFTAHVSCYSYAGWPNAPWTTISLCYGACIGGM